MNNNMILPAWLSRTMVATVLGGLLLGSIAPGQAKDNVKLHGTLVAEPCTLLPADENVELDFGTVINKYLYHYANGGRTASQVFTLKLTDCDLRLGDKVNIGFGGTESVALPGLLAMDGGHPKGVAIGLEDEGGAPITLNAAGKPHPLSQGTNLINFKAYVRGEPDAIAARSIETGTFTATATFTLDYPKEKGGTPATSLTLDYALSMARAALRAAPCSAPSTMGAEQWVRAHKYR